MSPPTRASLNCSLFSNITMRIKRDLRLSGSLFFPFTLQCFKKINMFTEAQGLELDNCKSKFKVRQTLEIQKCVGQEMGGNTNEISID